MSVFLLLFLLGLGLDPCAFVDQTENGVALVRFEDGTLELVATNAREGDEICGGTTRPRPHRPLTHRPLAARPLSLDELQE